MSISQTLSNVRVILKDTTHPGNIGSVARAMKTMGLSSLYLVATRTVIDSSSRALSAGATDVLDAVQIEKTLAPAISNCAKVFAFSARRRQRCPPCLLPRVAAIEIASTIKDNQPIALLFGGERSGLENVDIEQATHLVEIPTNPDYTSLNLSQAVQVAAYEIRQAVLDKNATDTPHKFKPTSTREEFEALMFHLQKALATMGLPKANDKRPLIARLRRLLNRAQPEPSEIRLLRGICKVIENKNSTIELKHRNP